MYSDKQMFESVILAGGLGSRLRSKVADRPKALAPINGKPFLDLLMERLVNHGCCHLVLSVGYLGDQIMSRYGANFLGMEVNYAVETKPLGTGGGLKLALKICRTPMPVVMNGDTFAEIDFQKFAKCECSRNNPVIAGVRVDNSGRYGRLVIRNKKICAFEEKGMEGPGYINAGCYLFPKDALAAFQDNESFSLEKDYLMACVNNAPLEFYPVEGQFIDIGVPEDYERAQKELRFLI